MSIKWIVYCTEPGDEGWYQVWKDTKPTECPNNAGHSIDLGSLRAVKGSKEILRIPIYTQTSLNTFFKIINFQYSPARMGDIRQIKAICYKDGSMSDFTVQILNITNNTQLTYTIVSNTNETVIVDLGDISNIPTSECILEISVKRNDGNPNSNIYFDEIVLYS